MLRTKSPSGCASKSIPFDFVTLQPGLHFLRIIMNPLGGIILAGGQSSRMGRPKPWLIIDGEPMLARIARVVSEVTSPVVVVAAVGQSLPELPANITRLDDDEPQLGPLMGLAVGLRALHTQAEAVFVTACDVPFFPVEGIRHLLANLGDADAVVPHVAGRKHLLTAVYRTRIWPQVVARLERRELALMGLLGELQVNWVEDLPPEWLTNLNTPEEYAANLPTLGNFPAKS
jgi:molybdenum cofactor guanylyltransferase